MGESNGSRQAGQNQSLEKTSNARNGGKVSQVVPSDTKSEQLIVNDTPKDVSEILDAFEFMKTAGLSELEFDSISQRSTKICVKRKTAGQRFVAEQQVVSVPTVSTSATKSDDEICDAASVKSPLSGTFYAASKHGAPPFVNVGDVVEEGKTLCIVEAMKVMNEIKADARYKILKVLAVNAKPVSANEALFLVKAM